MNYSRQRAEVLDQIREHEDHPTADVSELEVTFGFRRNPET